VGNPVRSENDAFIWSIAAAALAVVSLLIGWLTVALAGVAVFVAVGLVAIAVAVRRSRRPASDLADAARQSPTPHPADRTRHVLVVANAPLTGERLRERISPPGGGLVEVDVVAPVLPSRLHLAYTDVDAELAQARDTLDRSLSWLSAQGVSARGRAGDPSGASAAIADELREFPADEVIVVSAAGGDDWQAREELNRLRCQLDVRVEHLAV
jgi:hypothetical protein